MIWDRNLALALIGLFMGRRVLDMGCGQGIYTNAWREMGIEVDALDGSPWVTEMVNGAKVVDLAMPLLEAPDPPYDWVFCLEVGEHIPAEYESTFLDNICLCTRAGTVLSWAVPGQPGHGHFNCRKNSYVIKKMRERGFTYDHGSTFALRAVCELPYLRRTLMVFARQ